MNWFFALETHLKLAGASLIVLGLAHAFFDKRFAWKEEFSRVSLLNRQMFYVHTFFVALVVVLMGILSLFGTDALTEKTTLGCYVTGAITFFWLCRWVCQFWIYDAQLWRGKKFETFIHGVFSLFWTYLVIVFGWAFYLQSV